MKKAAAIILAAAAGSVLLLSLFGCGSKKKTGSDLPAGTLLVDYYRAAVAAPGDDGYYELTLSASGNGETAILDSYKCDDGSEEEHVSYTVPYEAVDRCMDAIKRSGFEKWSSRSDLVAEDGLSLVVKFRRDDGTYCRVSNDAMPKDGKSLLGNIGSIMTEYCKDEYLAG